MMKKDFKKLFVFFRSMKFGIILLVMIMALSMIGTVLPQGMDEYFYTLKYPVTAKLILLLGFNNIYNSILFGTLFIALTINLMMCSITRFGKIIKKVKANSAIENMELAGIENIDTCDSVNDQVSEVFRSYGFHKYAQDKIKTDVYCSIKNKAGYFGSWVLHFGILLVIIYYTYGQATYFSEAIYGVPGTVKVIEGTEYKLRIKDFHIKYDVEGTVQQYISDVELTDETGKSLKASDVAVNAPMRFEGLNFYQNGYGWAAKCNVLKSEDSILQEIIYEKSTLNLAGENIAIYFNSFYPDFAASPAGFTSLSDQLKNPAVLYTLLYMGNIVKMDIMPINEVIKWNDYEFVFHSPQRYTYLEVNRMNGQSGAAFGAFLVILGLMMAFYRKPSRMMVCVENGKIYVYRSTPEGETHKIKYQKEKDIC